MRCVRGARRADSSASFGCQMDSLYILIPLSLLIVLGIGAVLVWSVMSGQFEEMEKEGARVLEEDDSPRS